MRLKLQFDATPPFVYPCALASKLKRTEQCPFPGKGAEIIEFLFRAINVDYNLTTVVISISFVGSLINTQNFFRFVLHSTVLY